MSWGRRTCLLAFEFVTELDGQELFSSTGELTFFRKSQDLRIVSRNANQLKLMLRGGDRYKLVLSDGQAIQCFLSRVRGGTGLTEFTPETSPIVLDQGARLTELILAITNFGKYPFHTSRDRKMELSADGWNVTIIPCEKSTIQFPPNLQSKHYRLTHAARIRKADQSTFTSQEAQEILFLLSAFLSFSHGQQVSTSFVSGLNERSEAAYQVLGSGRVARWDEGDGWLDRIHTEGLPSVFPGFVRVYKDVDWHDALKTTLYWLSRGHINETGCDAALLVLQAALERLSWQILVISDQVTSRSLFKALKADQKIRKVLEHCSIPTAISSDLQGLLAFVEALPTPDGPSAICSIRNDLVHPEKRSARSKPFYEAYLLSRSYIDLILLRTFGYQGTYHNYAKLNRWVGQVESVPWASEQHGQNLGS